MSRTTSFCRVPIEDDEDPFDAARREFEEETGITPPSDRDAYLDLCTVKQSSRKRVAVWAVEADVDPAALDSNTFTVEWPPELGDRAALSGTGPGGLRRPGNGPRTDRRGTATGVRSGPGRNCRSVRRERPGGASEETRARSGAGDGATGPKRQQRQKKKAPARPGGAFFIELRCYHYKGIDPGVRINAAQQ